MTKITGHRGAAELAPENTLRAFQVGAEAGVDSIEFDVRATADDELVVMHDEAVDRTTDGTGKVGDLTLEEIRALDAGDGETVPTFAEALEFFVGREVDPRIELKEGELGPRVVDAVVDHGLESRTTISSFDHDALAAIADAPVALGVIDVEVTDEVLATVDRIGADALFVYVDEADREDVAAAADHGVILGVWTVNDPEAVDRALDIGVDAITSDRPDMVVRKVRGDG